MMYLLKINSQSNHRFRKSTGGCAIRVSELVDAILQEQSVFRSFSHWKTLNEKCTAFCAPDTDLVPHWNLVYPSSVDARFNESDRQLIQSFYGERGRRPHLLTLGDDRKNCSVERLHYLVLRESLRMQVALPCLKVDDGFMARHDVDLEAFADVVGAVFNFDEDTRRFFLSKMELMSRIDGSQFWIVYSGKRPIGTASTFLTENGGRFLFNVAIVQDVQNRGLGKSMLQTVVDETPRPIYVSSPNAAMVETILPSLGFECLGVANIVPIDRYSFASLPQESCS